MTSIAGTSSGGQRRRLSAASMGAGWTIRSAREEADPDRWFASSAPNARGATVRAANSTAADRPRRAAGRGKTMGDVMVCTSRDRLMPVVTPGGENDVENGQHHREL